MLILNKKESRTRKQENKQRTLIENTKNKGIVKR
jgi:hypothetical protein